MQFSERVTNRRTDMGKLYGCNETRQNLEPNLYMLSVSKDSCVRDRLACGYGLSMGAVER